MIQLLPHQTKELIHKTRLYYKCLQKYDEAEDLKPVYEFLKYGTEKA